MKLSIIAAMSQNRVIGKDNQLPWHIPADFKHFRDITMGKPILMGRKTYESIGKPLPGRTNIIITNNPDYRAEGCIIVHSIEDALDKAKDNEEVMIIGGASFYEQTLTMASRLYLTIIHEDFDGDAWFPEIDDKDWLETERTDNEPDENNPYPYSFVTLQRL